MASRWRPGSSLPEGIRPYARLVAALSARETTGERLTPYLSYIKLWARGRLAKAQARERKGEDHA